MKGAPAAVRTVDRRLLTARHSLELLLDGVLRPGHWAARLARLAGLQRSPAVSRFVVETPTLPAGMPPLRIAFASDFHAGATTHPALFARALEAIRAEAPHLVLFGGDFVTVRASYVRELRPLLDELDPPLGKFAVLGNHDLRAHRPTLLAALADANVRLLANTQTRLPPPFEGVTVCGLDDPIRGRPDPAAALDGATAARIVLMHAPDGLLSLGARPFCLAFCGHTHGGQIALPGGRPIVVPAGRLSRTYARGRFDLGEGRTLIVSRGVGCSTVPFRAFARSEVVSVVLRGTGVE
jgi:uncharacterized protein